VCRPSQNPTLHHLHGSGKEYILCSSSLSLLATSWTVRGQIPVGGRFSEPFQTGPGTHPASCVMGTGSLPRKKPSGRGSDHPPPSINEDKERVEPHFYSPSLPLWPVLGWPLPHYATWTPFCYFLHLVHIRGSSSIRAARLQPSHKFWEKLN
jgi:hypothetical protein